MGHRWTRETATLASRKGLETRRKRAAVLTPGERRAYQRGWIACERFYRRMREQDRSRA